MRMVQPNAQHTWCARKLAVRWSCHPSSVARIMRRFGCNGLKFSPSQQGARRYLDADVRLVEKLCGLSSRRDVARNAVRNLETEGQTLRKGAA